MVINVGFFCSGNPCIFHLECKPKHGCKHVDDSSDKICLKQNTVPVSCEIGEICQVRVSQAGSVMWFSF